MSAQFAMVAVGALAGLSLAAVFWTLGRLMAPPTRQGFQLRYEHLPEHHRHDR